MKYIVLFRIPNPFNRRIPTLLQVSVTDNSFTYNVQDTDTKRLFPRWKLEVRFGTGAGCVWGRTFYLACNLFYSSAATYPSEYDHWWEHIAFGAKGRDYCTPRRWQMGFTQNWNMIPTVDGA